jgi:hypothetical protein
MKKFSLLALAAVGLLFGACSSNESVDEGKNPLLGNDNGFFKVNLNLPTSVVTSNRAGWNDEGDNVVDGKDTEYGVASVLLLIFEGTNESAATLKQVIAPTETTEVEATDNPNQITAIRQYVAQLDNAPTSNLYALAVINGSGIIEAGTVNTAVKLNGVAGDHSGITIADLQVETANSMREGDSFFMTNAVLSKSHGGDTNPDASPTLQILAPVKTEYIYETKAAAEAGVPATDIYVERGVAKVTLDATALSAAALKMKGGAAIDFSFEGWILDNTETNSYIVRKINRTTPEITLIWNLKSYDPAVTLDPYRFVGGNAVDKLYGTQNLYRTYWAIDPNYDNDAMGKTTSTSLTFPAKTAVGNDYPQYCHENTFDVAHQTYQNTTRAVVKVNLSANDFYTIGADRNTLYTLDDVADLVKTDLMDQSAFAAWWATQSTLELTAGDLTINFSSDDAGVVTVTDVTVNKDKCDKIAHATNPSVKTEVGSAVITTLNNSQLGKVEYFKGGVSYYQIRIKHFGDDLTPWNSGEYATAPVVGVVDNIYPVDARRDANYLGRYGMVRNNWYDIHLGAILKIGSSTVPTLPGDDTPDDNLDEVYIKARINILSWAKRTQSWTLK